MGPLATATAALNLPVPVGALATAGRMADSVRLPGHFPARHRESAAGIDARRDTGHGPDDGAPRAATAPGLIGSFDLWRGAATPFHAQRLAQEDDTDPGASRFGTATSSYRETNDRGRILPGPALGIDFRV